MSEQVTLMNTTDSVLCIADHAQYYATLDPGKTISVSADWLSKDAFSGPVRHGWLAQVKAQAFKGGNTKGSPMMAPRKQQDVVSFKTEDEAEPETRVVSAVRPGQDDVSVDKDHGAKIVRRGRGRPPKMTAVKTTMVPKDVQDEVDEVDASQGRGFTIQPGMPGQAKMVPVEKDVMSNLEAMASRQEEIWRDLERERKLIGYAQMDEKRRTDQIDDESDIKFLKNLLQMEKSAKLAIRIKNRIKNLALGDDA